MFCPECRAEARPADCGTCYVCEACRMHYLYSPESFGGPAYYLYPLDDAGAHGCVCDMDVDTPQGDRLEGGDMSEVHAYKWLVEHPHGDGTPSTEAVTLLCEECFRNAWARQSGTPDWQQLRNSVIREQLRPAVADAEVQGRNWQDLAHRGVDYDQALDGFCLHLEQQLGVERGPWGELRR